MMDEAPVWVGINGIRLTVLTCSPVRVESLGAGHAMGSGWISGATALHGVHAVQGPGGALGADLLMDPADADAAMEHLHHVISHGCGVRHILDCSDSATRAITAGAPPSPRQLAEALRQLFSTADEASPDGGVHAAAFCDGHALEHASVDVARHCAVDRVVGAALLAGEPPAGAAAPRGIVTTSRISGSIALKAAYAGVPWMASRSIATPLAHEIAARAGVRIIERAARTGGAGG
jgi:FdhD protein